MRQKMSELLIDKINNLIFTIPHLSEQTAIADFLDRKTAELDSLIEKKARLIQLYEEEKAAMTNQAVTQGLDPHVSMKPSGIEWLGDIPAYWEVKRLKYVAYFSRGFDLSSSNFKKGIYPVYGSNGIIGYHNEFTTKAPSITIGRSGSVGEINFVDKDFWAHNTSLYLLKNFKNVTKFLFFLLSVLDLKSYSEGTAVGTLNRNNIHEILVAVPTVPEQTAIVTHIETECARIDAIIAKFKKQIRLFREYRTTLISEVVTGKIDVREA